jgi:hypothetical protein
MVDFAFLAGSQLLSAVTTTSPGTESSVNGDVETAALWFDAMFGDHVASCEHTFHDNDE